MLAFAQAEKLLLQFKSAISDREVRELISRDGVVLHSLVQKALAPHFDLGKPLPIVPLQHAGDELCAIPRDRYTVAPPRHPLQHYIFRETECGQIPIRMHSISSGYLSIDTGKLYNPEFYIFDDDRNLVDELAFGAQPFLDDSNLSFIDEPIAFIEDRFAKFNVSHFLFDKLARSLVIKDFTSFNGSFLSFSENDYISTIAQQANIRFISVPRSSKKCTIYFSGGLVVINTSFPPIAHPCFFLHPAAVRILRAFTQRPPPTVAGEQREDLRIFIDRSRADTRRIVNWADIEPIARRMGFHIADPSTMRPLEQQALFRQATMIAGVHGAGLANLAFAAPGAKLLELLPPLIATPEYWKLSHAFGLEYDAFVCQDPDGATPDYSRWQHNARYNRRDVIVDPAGFDAFLSQNLP